MAGEYRKGRTPANNKIMEFPGGKGMPRRQLPDFKQRVLIMPDRTKARPNGWCCLAFDEDGSRVLAKEAPWLDAMRVAGAYLGDALPFEGCEPRVMIDTY